MLGDSAGPRSTLERGPIALTVQLLSLGVAALPRFDATIDCLELRREELLSLGPDELD